MSKKSGFLGTIFKWIVLCLCAITAFGFMMNIFRRDKNDETPGVDDVLPGNGYSITYRGIVDGEDGEIYAGMWSTNGSYPTFYEEGKETAVSDLLGKMTYISEGEFAGAWCGSGVPDKDNPRKDYSFYGWYWDATCENEFDGRIDENQTGDITLYAKISVGYWTAIH